MTHLKDVQWLQVNIKHDKQEPLRRSQSVIEDRLVGEVEFGAARDQGLVARGERGVRCEIHAGQPNFARRPVTPHHLLTICTKRSDVIHTISDVIITE